jgi:hypothetical protein
MASIHDSLQVKLMWRGNCVASRPNRNNSSRGGCKITAAQSAD